MKPWQSAVLVVATLLAMLFDAPRWLWGALALAVIVDELIVNRDT